MRKHKREARFSPKEGIMRMCKCNDKVIANNLLNVILLAIEISDMSQDKAKELQEE